MQTLRAGPGRGAQILLVRNPDHDKDIVAKVYDPMYYSCGEDSSCSSYCPYDWVRQADADYAVEAAAYAELDPTSFPGSLTPRFYGSWTCKVLTRVEDKEIYRNVRLILMEHVEGICMKTLDARKLTSEQRDNIMVKLIEGDVDLCYEGIQHEDLAPRNVILANPVSSSQATEDSTMHDAISDSMSQDSINLSSPDLRVCLIDFNLSSVKRLRPDFDPFLPRPRYSPVMEWWGKISVFQQLGWVPEDTTNEWLWQHWENSNGMYIDAERDPDEPECGPLPVGWMAMFGTTT